MNAKNYSTPLGSFPNWEEAAKALERADMDPCTCIQIEDAPPASDWSWVDPYGCVQNPIKRNA